MNHVNEYKMMKKICLAAALILGFTACEKDSLMRYDLGRYVNFSRTDEENATVFSFSHYPGYDSYTLSYDVQMTGDLPGEDLAYALAVDAESTATAEMYELNLHPVLKKGEEKGSVEITLKNPGGILTDREVTLIVRIAPNENFQPGFEGYRTVRIDFNDKVSKPLWWNEVVEIYLGGYDEVKFREFVKCTGVVSLDGVEETMIRFYALRFKEYIAENGLDIDIPAY